MNQTIRGLLAITLTIAALALPASAQEAGRSEAEKLFRAGEAAYNKGKYAEAADMFESAYKTLPLPAIAFSAAQAHRLQYFKDQDPPRLKRAVELYRLYIEQVKEGQRVPDAVANLAELSPILLRMEEAAGEAGIQAMTTTARVTRLVVSSKIKEASISINGKQEGSGTVMKDVSKGTYSVKVEAPGYFPYEKQEEVFDGQYKVVEVALDARPGLISLATESGSEVFIDGRPAGTTPLSRPVEVEAGVHVVSVSHRGRSEWSQTVTVERGEPIEIKAHLQTSIQRKSSYWTFIAAGAVFATSGVYAVLALSSDGKATDLRDDIEAGVGTPDDVIRFNELIGERNDRRRNSLILAGVGTGIAAIGAALWLFDHPGIERFPAQSSPVPAKEPSNEGVSPVAVSPLFAPDFAGLGLSGSF